MAGAIVGGALLSASIEVLLHRMASREVLTFLRRQRLSATLLRKLRIKLLAVQVVLDDAEAKQFTKSAVKDWLDDLKDAVYDAEDLLDDITTETLRCKMESDAQTSATQVRDITSASLNPFGGGIESRVEEITDKLEYLAQEKDVLGLKEGVGEKLSQRWPATSLVDESGEVYGREGNIKEIIEYLLSHNASGNKISVIALVGMGGIGKTTLAQLVYNDRRVVECFDLKAWVCVSDEFDLVRITKTILKEIDSGASEKYSDDSDLNLLQLKVKERLSKKKFLLVLDDVWNENYTNWHMLQTPFTVGLNGSKIIVTTRSDKVASIMRSVHIHHLGQLSFEDCWSLFAKHAFENGDSSLHPELEEIGKGIVKKCKGLPLAAKTLGGALYSELRVKEWEFVLNSETWDLPNDEILPALRLSYSFLPSHLKRCFAYCSIFPKDYEFEKENLILLWMAEGFLQQFESKKTMEEVGDGHSKVKEMPSHMGQLKSLQKLSNYIVGKQSGTRVGELRKLSHIGGSLVIQELQNVVDAKDASEANLVGKKYLDELQLEWNRGSHFEQNGADIVLNNLQPHSNLKRLTIYSYGGSRFPDWLGPSILNVVSLRLWNCKNVSTFPPLGQLPSLKHLYILGLREIERVGVEFYGTDPSFVSLKALSFEGMPKWKEWLCMGGQGGEFPRLKELYIEDCPKLIGDLPTDLLFLTTLRIEKCEQLFLLPEFLKCHHPSLAYLSIFSGTCNSLSSFPLGNFPSLTHLIISDLKGLESLSISISEGDMLGEERSQTIFKVIAVQSMVLFHQVQYLEDGYSTKPYLLEHNLSFSSLLRWWHFESLEQL
uniref:Disease resistance RPP13-like protein 1 n=1 Tax=Vitis vinifera TaxID=29760 RepID=F6H8Z2_VITVI